MSLSEKMASRLLEIADSVDHGERATGRTRNRTDIALESRGMIVRTEIPWSENSGIVVTSEGRAEIDRIRAERETEEAVDESAEPSPSPWWAARSRWGAEVARVYGETREAATTAANRLLRGRDLALRRLHIHEVAEPLLSTDGETPILAGDYLVFDVRGRVRSGCVSAVRGGLVYVTMADIMEHVLVERAELPHRRAFVLRASVYPDVWTRTRAAAWYAEHTNA
ncbi:hypothetical protein ACIQFP_10520 [Nocardiopsis alba]|uniref:hypothetical protein n=1 Tax=Nocardiopsis alba TaxID=53437 RepID=UPI00380F5EFF